MKKKTKKNVGLFLKNELPLIAWRNRCVEYVLHAALWWQGPEMCYRKGLVEPPEGNDPAGAPAWKKSEGFNINNYDNNRKHYCSEEIIHYLRQGDGGRVFAQG